MDRGKVGVHEKIYGLLIYAEARVKCLDLFLFLISSVLIEANCHESGYVLIIEA